MLIKSTSSAPRKSSKYVFIETGIITLYKFNVSRGSAAMYANFICVIHSVRLRSSDRHKLEVGIDTTGHCQRYNSTVYTCTMYMSLNYIIVLLLYFINKSVYKEFD